ncbi:polyketide synthase dehydratase domain-containing protein, partial [Burkholderia pseudomallei]
AAPAAAAAGAAAAAAGVRPLRVHGPSGGGAGARRTTRQGTIRLAPGAAAPAAARVDVAALHARCTREIGAQRFSTFLDSGGGHYGPTFRSVAALLQGVREVLARL